MGRGSENSRALRCAGYIYSDITYANHTTDYYMPSQRCARRVETARRQLALLWKIGFHQMNNDVRFTYTHYHTDIDMLHTRARAHKHPSSDE